MIAKRNKILALVVIGMFVIMAGQALFGIGVASAASNKISGGDFLLGTTVNEQISNMNPLTDSNLAGDITGITYADSLIHTFANGSYIPWLANGYNITNGGNTITFNIAHNAYWMNGTTKAQQLTSQDVNFTFQVLAANSSLDANNVIPFIQSISTPDKYTVVFHLSKPNVMIFYYIGEQTIIPYSWHNMYSNISDLGNFNNMNLATQLTCGPMIMKNVTSTSVNLVANPYFFKGKPNFASETVVEFKSSSSMIEALQAGTIDATYVDPNNLFNEINQTPGLKAVAYKTTFDLNLWFDDKVAPYNNTNFRIGLAYALNDTAILQKAEDGLGGNVSSGGLPWTQSAYYNASLPKISFNYTIANQYFKKAGLSVGSSGFWQYPNGTVVKINLVDLPLADWDTAMSLIQTNLINDQFSVSYAVVPTQVWVDDVLSGSNYNYASFFNFGPLFGNPWYDLWAAYDSHGYWNFEFYNNSKLDALFNQSQAQVTNPTAFNATINKIQGIIASQMPVIPIMGSEVYYAYATNAVGGFWPNEQLISPLDSEYAYMASGSSNNSPGLSGSTPYIIGGVVAAVIVIGAGTAVYMRNKKKEE